uniref:Uncharacterized protein n=1 Tax=Cacopsylla melanoneura TaxID=428564 RepID=A0A8D9EV46_9HEMI
MRSELFVQPTHKRPVMSTVKHRGDPFNLLTLGSPFISPVRALYLNSRMSVCSWSSRPVLERITNIFEPFIFQARSVQYSRQYICCRCPGGSRTARYPLQPMTMRPMGSVLAQKMVLPFFANVSPTLTSDSVQSASTTSHFRPIAYLLF